MFKNTKILVTGGRTGFLGTNIAKVLLERGATVYAHSTDLSSPGFFEKNTPNLIETAGDLRVSASIPDGVEYVFHCAAHTSGAHEMVTNPAAQITPNVFMNSNLADAAAKAKVKKFLFISSSAVYPDMEEAISEDQGFVGDPPRTYFGPAWMKRYTEKLLEFYYRQCGMEVVIIRPSNVYGPYSGFDPQRAHVLPALIRKFVEKQNPIEVWGSPDVVRDFIYSDDFVRGILTTFEKSSGYDVFNIASGHQYTIHESVQNIKELTWYNGTITYNSSKPMTIGSRIIDTAKAEKVLQFKASTSFREGLQKTIDWYRGTLKGQG